MSQAPDHKDGTVLIVEDDARYAESVVAPVFSAHHTVRHAFNVPEALELIAAGDEWRLAIVDLDLPGGGPFHPDHPGGAGFHVVAAFRKRHPDVHVIVLTGYLLPWLVNTAQRLGAEYLSKEGAESNLLQVAESLRGAASNDLRRAELFASNLGANHGLSPRQVEIIELALHGKLHREIAGELGISVNTLKKHVGLIVTRCNAPSLSAIVRQFLGTRDSD